MKRGSKPALPKQRNFYAASLRDPRAPFAPKIMTKVSTDAMPRKRKHKKKEHSDD